MNLQQGEVNDGVNTSQFRVLICKYLSFIPQAAKQRMSSHCTYTVIFALCVDLFIFINFQGHLVLKNENTHSSCQVTT